MVVKFLVENCMSNQIYCFIYRRISNIIKELLENEENYVQTLEKGIENYVGVMNQKDLPPALRGQKYHIFGNIESIYEFHKYKFLPKLRDNCASIQGVAETFIQLIEDNRFYCYILFALNRPKSEKICNKNLDFFQVSIFHPWSLISAHLTSYVSLGKTTSSWW